MLSFNSIKVVSDIIYLLFFCHTLLFQVHSFLRQPFGNRDNRVILLLGQNRIRIVRTLIFPRQFVDGTFFLITHIIVIWVGNSMCRSLMYCIFILLFSFPWLFNLFPYDCLHLRKRDRCEIVVVHSDIILCRKKHTQPRGILSGIVPTGMNVSE